MKNKIEIIAEIGVNHNGSLKKAKTLINKAKEAGADYVKFQYFKSKLLSTDYAKKAKYQYLQTKKKETQLEMLKKFELNIKDLKKLKAYSSKKKIKFLVSAFDEETLLELKKLKISTFKVPSGEITNIPYLKLLGSFKKKVILSTGMSNFKEISKAVKTLLKSGLKKKNLCLLQCTSNYPTKISDTNLSVIKKLKKKYKTKVGFSDHTKELETPLYAIFYGAEIIEKHITLSNKDKGPDHKASLNAYDFVKMMKIIKNFKLSYGKSVKKANAEEIKNSLVVRKSLVAKINIKKGDKFSYKNLTYKRPGNGLAPNNIYYLLGKKSPKDFKINKQINLK